MKSKLNLSEAAVVSVRVYGCEVWMLDEALCASLRGWCARCLTHITNRSTTEECKDPPYPLVSKSRQRRLRWLGHILRKQERSLVRKMVLEVASQCLNGKQLTSKTILMDTAIHKSVEELVEKA